MLPVDRWTDVANNIEYTVYFWANDEIKFRTEMDLTSFDDFLKAIIIN